jgi:starch phosphorylase
LAALEQLSINLRWSWDKPTQDLFATIDEPLWLRHGQDPVALLGAVSPRRLEELASDNGFLQRLDGLAADLADYLDRPLWYQQQRDAGAVLPTGIAYFSMEFGVAEVLPNYSGGLGILAGDHLKSASDLGLPLIAVGLYYRSGYFRQSLTADGWQHETYPSIDPQGLPLRLLTTTAGNPVLVELALPDAAQLRARVWIAQVGRIPLLLLDSDIPENGHDLRGVTDRLYGGDQEHRIKQEILAGVGGVRAIRAFTGIEGLPQPEVFHMNEGHAGFLGVERIRELSTGAGWTSTPRGRWCAPALCSPLTPRCLRASTGSRWRWSVTTSMTPPRRRCCPACLWTGSSRSARRMIRRSSIWRTWACGSRSAPTAFPCCTAV